MYEIYRDSSGELHFSGEKNIENISIIEYSKDDKEEKKSNIEIITSMINPKEWFEDITKRAKILREKYFKGKEGEKENKD